MVILFLTLAFFGTGMASITWSFVSGTGAANRSDGWRVQLFRRNVANHHGGRRRLHAGADPGGRALDFRRILLRRVGWQNGACARVIGLSQFSGEILFQLAADCL